MGGHALRARTRARIERLCAARFDPEALRLELVAELRRAVGFEGFCWPLTDPGSATAGTTVFNLPLTAADMPRFVRLRHGINDINRHTVLATSRSHAASLYAATGGDLARCVHWRESLGPYGIRDELTVAFADAYGCWGFTDVYRADGPFDSDDVALVEDIAPAVTGALRAAQARRHLTAPTPPPERFGPAVLILDDGLRLVSRTPAAGEWLRVLQSDNTREAEIPGWVYALTARLDAVESGLDTLPASLRVQAPSGTLVSLRAARLDGGFGHYAVTIEQASPEERLDLVGRAVGLSARQRELLMLAAAGLDTREMSRRLFLSEHTVQEHFKAIFVKTGVNSRRELLSRAMGTMAASCPATQASVVAG